MEITFPAQGLVLMILMQKSLQGGRDSCHLVLRIFLYNSLVEKNKNKKYFIKMFLMQFMQIFSCVCQEFRSILLAWYINWWVVVYFQQATRVSNIFNFERSTFSVCFIKRPKKDSFTSRRGGGGWLLCLVYTLGIECTTTDFLVDCNFTLMYIMLKKKI